MPPKAQKEIVYPITSEEQFYQIVNPENKKLHGTLFTDLLINSDRCSSFMVWAMCSDELQLQKFVFRI